MFCSHHYNLIPEHLHHSKEKTAHISSPSPLAATHLFPVHMNRVILDISHKMEADIMGPFVSGFFHLAGFQVYRFICVVPDISVLFFLAVYYSIV